MAGKTTLYGYIRANATANSDNPLQTTLDLILTDFSPNKNKQGIPETEKTNIIRSALYSPLKIYFDGEKYSGHAEAIAIGPIIQAYEGNDNGRDVIFGKAVIWNEYHKKISEYLKQVFNDGIGTSWEIYYGESDIDNDGVEWLHDCVFAGTCIVETPAYGDQRTRVLAIAEILESEKKNMAEEVASVDATKNENGKADSAKTDITSDLESTRTALSDLQSLLYKMFDGLDMLYAETFEIERNTATQTIDEIALQFSDKISKVVDKVKEMRGSVAEKQTALDSATAELESLKQEKIDAEKAKAEEEKLSARKVKLTEAGIKYDDETDDRKELFRTMDDTIFINYVNDLKAIRSNSANASVNMTKKIPEPPVDNNDNNDNEVDLKTVGTELKDYLKTKR